MTPNDTTLARILEQLIADGPQEVAAIVTTLMNLAMRAEREQFLGAGHYQRAPERRGHANGFKPKRVDTPAGTLVLTCPRPPARPSPSFRKASSAAAAPAAPSC